MKTVIVIPTYNEKENIQKLIPEILNVDEGFNVLVVDDNSPDGTGKVVDRFIEDYPSKISILHRKDKLGFASAYIEGFQEVVKRDDVDYIFSMDADFSHNPKYLKNFIEKLENYDVVVGSRYMNETISVINWPIRRLILSRLANFYAQIVTGLKVFDCTSGFIGYRRKVLEGIDFKSITSDGYSFLIEMKYRAYKKGYKITEVPIVFEERRLGQSKISKSIIFEALFVVWRLRLGL